MSWWNPNNTTGLIIKWLSVDCFSFVHIPINTKVGVTADINGSYWESKANFWKLKSVWRASYVTEDKIGDIQLQCQISSVIWLTNLVLDKSTFLGENQTVSSNIPEKKRPLTLNLLSLGRNHDDDDDEVHIMYYCIFIVPTMSERYALPYICTIKNTPTMRWLH